MEREVQIGELLEIARQAIELAGVGPSPRPRTAPPPHHRFSVRDVLPDSNQWVLEVLTAALAPRGAVRTRAAAQAWVEHGGYTPAHIYVARWSASVPDCSRPMCASTTTPEEARRSGRYHVVFADSFLAFLGRLDPEHRRRVVTPD